MTLTSLVAKSSVRRRTTVQYFVEKIWSTLFSCEGSSADASANANARGHRMPSVVGTIDQADCYISLAYQVVHKASMVVFKHCTPIDAVRIHRTNTLINRCKIAAHLSFLPFP